ncbi:hypothetical protein FZEAL_5882 [Fusarium zealandicum]|uniref:HTH La-type RNA-binding domain-containing protein n=1 Tax=Fusarium zealandicum TaxID=1053134 RepID=A0A8H4UJ88_9HYPO|nr:hypothetical protein FZEAL_5882 [Fusarium zealandicum]
MSPSAIIESNEMAPPSTFSYAQAAKGQGAVTPSNSDAPNDAAAPAQDAPVPAADAAAPVADVKTATPAVDPAEVPEASESVEPRAAAPEKQDFESVPGSESGDAQSVSTQERRSESRRDDDAGRLDRPWRRNDKTPRSSSNTTRSADEQDSRKARRSKKGKASEKQSGDQATDREQEAVPEPPKVELSEAPIPSVNIWHQRKEAHATKTKPGPTPAEATVNGTSSQKEDDKPVSKPAEESTPAPYTNGIKPQQKAVSAARPERNGPRGSRSSEKDGKVGVPPSVEDATAWPTPETAITSYKDDKKKTTEKSVEKSDRPDKDSQEDGQSKPRQKWVTYDYVPTVSFETQLPQMRGSKPRGGARGGRDTATRATGNGVADKTAPAVPVNKTNESKPRDASAANGAAAQPATAKRGSLDAANGQKKASANAGSDKAKDSTAQTTETAQASRDRPEGRGERGRGGYRGRGAHHVSSQSQHQHSSSAGFHNQNGSGRAQGHYSPPLRQGAHGGMFAPPAQRGRGGRNGANNYHRMSLPNSTSRIPAVQAQFAPYDYSMAPMAGIPFQPQPYWDNMVMPMLKSQIEYYFSIENLCKDMYLRQRMDSQGFVPLHFITAFKRMRDLSADMNLIRAVCEDSVEVDYVVGEDDCERLRRREDWQKFVLPMEDRDELARNNGPAHVTFKNRAYNYANGQFNGIPPMPYGSHGYPANPLDPSFQPYMDSTQAAPGVNGIINGNGTSQLSAEVPDFSPTGTIPLAGFEGKVSQASKANASTELLNGHVETVAPLTNGVHAEEGQATQS